MMNEVAVALVKKTYQASWPVFWASRRGRWRVKGVN